MCPFKGQRFLCNHHPPLRGKPTERAPHESSSEACSEFELLEDVTWPFWEINRAEVLQRICQKTLQVMDAIAIRLEAIAINSKEQLSES